MYGISDKGLSANEHIPLKDAKKAIDGLMEAYPKMKAKIDYDQSFAEKHGYVENMMGFRRRLGELGLIISLLPLKLSGRLLTPIYRVLDLTVLTQL